MTETRDEPVKVAMVLYEGMTALDMVGPYEMLRLLPDVEVVLVAAGGGTVMTDSGVLALGPAVDLDAVDRADVVVVPGGPGTAAALSGPLVPWLAAIHAHTRWTTSVCSGSLLLGAAGLLKGLSATSHFAVRDRLTLFGAEPVAERFVVHAPERIVTAAGVSAGIDLALHLIELLTDEVTADAIRLITEYDPRPPRPGGSLENVSAEVIARAVEIGTAQGAIPAGWTAGS